MSSAVKLKRLMLLILLAFGAIALLLYLFQAKLIYTPLRYQSGVAEKPGSGLTPLRYSVDGKPRVAFRRAPSPGGRYWIAFSGNGGVALDWDYVASSDTANGFLLIDHPGFGANDGVPNPASIDANADAALAALAVEEHATPDSLAKSSGVLGHSLGAAIALRFATRHPVSRVVLLAPFTSMRDMARRQVGWPFCEVLTHRYDNRAALAVIAAQHPRPPVTILHGMNDALIPISMSQSMSRDMPWITLHELPDVDHNNIIFKGKEIGLAMSSP